MEHPVTLAHVSDLHATPVRSERLQPLLSKRAFGWLSWKLRRRRRHRVEVLEALVADLARQAPHQVAVTGDLTNVALEEEFPAAAAWLARLGPPSRVSAIPGNHDAYVAVPAVRGWDLWRDYLASDPEARRFGEPAPDGFPSLRLRGPLALVGLCSAQPTGFFLASGRVGDDQLARLGDLLAALRDAGWCRVVMIHHPPEPGVVSPRRALGDAAGLCDVLRRRGAELVLHGHLHRTRVGRLEGPEGPIPVLGVPSASHAGPGVEKSAAYHLLDIETRAGARPRIRLRTRGYDPVSGTFAARGPEEGALLGA